MEWGGIKDVCPVTVGFLCVVCLSCFSLSVCRRGFQAELRIRPSSLFMLFGCISISMASLIQGSETSANYNLMPGKYPEENIQYSNHGESLKSRIWDCVLVHFSPFRIFSEVKFSFMHSRIIFISTRQPFKLLK